MNPSPRARQREMMMMATSVAALFFGVTKVAAQGEPSGRAIRYPMVAPSAVVQLTTPSVKLDLTNCELNHVVGVIQQSTGGIALGNAGENQFCFFDSAGRFLKTAGRKGSGPGEFIAMQAAQLYRGDSVAVYDLAQRRVTILGPAGQRGREFAVNKPDSLGSNTLVMALASGEFVLGFSEITTAAPRPEAAVFHQQLFVASPDGVIGKRIGRFVESEHFIQRVPPEMGGVAYWDVPWSGSFFAKPYKSGFVAGDGADAVLGEYDTSGRMTRAHDAGLQRRPVTPEMIDRHKTNTLDSKGQPRAVLDKLAAEMPYPRELPAYRSILVDPQGPIWIAPYLDPAAAYWLRLDPSNGTVRGFRFPLGFSLWSVRVDRACGLARDADDLQTVYCFGIPR